MTEGSFTDLFGVDDVAFAQVVGRLRRAFEANSKINELAAEMGIVENGTDAEKEKVLMAVLFGRLVQKNEDAARSRMAAGMAEEMMRRFAEERGDGGSR